MESTLEKHFLKDQDFFIDFKVSDKKEVLNLFKANIENVIEQNEKTQEHV